MGPCVSQSQSEINSIQRRRIKFSRNTSQTMNATEIDTQNQSSVSPTKLKNKTQNNEKQEEIKYFKQTFDQDLDILREEFESLFKQISTNANEFEKLANPILYSKKS